MDAYVKVLKNKQSNDDIIRTVSEIKQLTELENKELFEAVLNLFSTENLKYCENAWDIISHFRKRFDPLVFNKLVTLLSSNHHEIFNYALGSLRGLNELDDMTVKEAHIENLKSSVLSRIKLSFEYLSNKQQFLKKCFSKFIWVIYCKKIKLSEPMY